MNQANKRGFKPGANMPHDDYDPMEQGMSDSGNHAVGHPGNDNPTTNAQHGRQPARSEQSVRQGNLGRSYYDSKQAAASAAAQTTHRYNAAGARGDSNTGKSR